MNKDLLLTDGEINDTHAPCEENKKCPREDLDCLKCEHTQIVKAQLDKVLRELFLQFRHGKTEHGTEFWGIAKTEYENLFKAIVPELPKEM